MSTDLEQALNDAAKRPSRQVDAADLVRRADQRTRTTRVLLSVVAVLALVAGGFALQQALTEPVPPEIVAQPTNPHQGATDTGSAGPDAPPGVRVTVTYLNESGEPPSHRPDPIITGPMDITLQPYAHQLEIPTGGPEAEPLEGLPDDAQTVEAGLLRLDLERIPPAEYDIPIDHILDTAVVRVRFERTEPTVDVDVQGDWTLRTLERNGDPMTAPPDGTYTLQIDGISMGGTIDCNEYWGVLTVDGDDVNARYGGQNDGGCRDYDAQPAAVAFTDAFAQGLDGAERVERDGDTLRLRSRETTLIFDRT